jgi:hypothetical protein
MGYGEVISLFPCTHGDIHCENQLFCLFVFHGHLHIQILYMHHTHHPDLSFYTKIISDIFSLYFQVCFIALWKYIYSCISNDAKK